MTSAAFKIKRIDTRNTETTAEIARIREQLSPRGDVVSEAGRKKTLEVFGEALSPQQVVAKICGDVESKGLDALLDYCKRIDGAELTGETIRVSEAEMKQAHADAAPEFIATVRHVRDSILYFQTAILHRDVAIERAPGILLRQRYVPLRRVGICVPGGAAAYPSSVLMAAVPAQAAGVDEIAVVAPPTPFGANNPDVMATCYELGIKELYRIGGAHAVAAMAYGVEGLPAVDKIVGPGNMFVALAKKQVFGQVDIDSIAGPSEVILIADSTYDPEYAAADLLAQAEHSPGASIMLSWDDDLLEETEAALGRQLEKLSRSELTRKSLQDYGCLIRVKDAAEACQLTEAFAPEHLHIATSNAGELAEQIRNAGATFLGRFSPVAMGDYAAGPSHVLPTSGTATWAAGLSANDFVRSGSMIEYGKAGLAADAPHVLRLAEKEGLTAHFESVNVRLNEK